MRRRGEEDEGSERIAKGMKGKREEERKERKERETEGGANEEKKKKIVGPINPHAIGTELCTNPIQKKERRLSPICTTLATCFFFFLFFSLSGAKESFFFSFLSTGVSLPAPSPFFQSTHHSASPHGTAQWERNGQVRKEREGVVVCVDGGWGDGTEKWTQLLEPWNPSLFAPLLLLSSILLFLSSHLVHTP